TEALALCPLSWALLDRVGKPHVRRRFPAYVQPLLVFLAVGLASAAIVGGIQGLVGVKVGFFWALIGFVAWLAPLDARHRDMLVTVLMVDGVPPSSDGFAQ